MWDLIVHTDTGSTAYNLDSLAFVSLVGHDGLGMPPVENFYEQQSQQDGATYLGMRMRPRPVHLVFGAETDYSEDVWERRQAILRVLRPGYRLSLQHTSVDGKVRRLDCYYSDGLQMPSDSKVGMLLKVGVTLIALDPYWYDPTPVVFTRTATVDDGNPDSLIEIVYEGSVDSYPVIRIESANTPEKPMYRPVIGHYLNLSDMLPGVILDLAVNISSEFQATYDLAYGVKTVTGLDISLLESNLAQYLSEVSDISTFRLRAAVDGTDSRSNYWAFSASSTALLHAYTYTLTVTYYKRYLGI